MQNRPASLRLWFDNTNPTLVEAAKKLRRWTDWHKTLIAASKLAELTWLRTLIVISMSVIVNEVFGSRIFLWTISVATGGVLVLVVAEYVVGHICRNLRFAIERGAFGFAAMWSTSVEWKKLEAALRALGYNMRALMSDFPDVVRTPISEYLTWTVNERRRLRTGRGKDSDTETLEATARAAANAIHFMVTEP